MACCKYLTFPFFLKYKKNCPVGITGAVVVRSELFDPFIKSGLQIYWTNFNWEITLPVQISALLVYAWAESRPRQISAVTRDHMQSGNHLTMHKKLYYAEKNLHLYCFSRIVLKCRKLGPQMDKMR